MLRLSAGGLVPSIGPSRLGTGIGSKLHLLSVGDLVASINLLHTYHPGGLKEWHPHLSPQPGEKPLASEASSLQALRRAARSKQLLCSVLVERLQVGSELKENDVVKASSRARVQDRSSYTANQHVMTVLPCSRRITSTPLEVLAISHPAGSGTCVIRGELCTTHVRQHPVTCMWLQSKTRCGTASACHACRVGASALALSSKPALNAKDMFTQDRADALKRLQTRSGSSVSLLSDHIISSLASAYIVSHISSSLLVLTKPLRIRGKHGYACESKSLGFFLSFHSPQ